MPARDHVRAPCKNIRKAFLIGSGVVRSSAARRPLIRGGFDINSWKSGIEAAASHASGMEVTIKGKVGLTRWLPSGVVIDDIQFRVRGDAILNIESVKLLSLKLVPLLRTRVHVSACELVGPVITVVKDADGRFNFESASEKATPAGRIDLPRESYQDAIVAVLDDRGCSRFTQRLSGPIAHPRLLTLGSFESAKCEVVYNGSVRQPHEAAEPGHRSRP